MKTIITYKRKDKIILTYSIIVLVLFVLCLVFFNDTKKRKPSEVVTRYSTYIVFDDGAILYPIAEK